MYTRLSRSSKTVLVTVAILLAILVGLLYAGDSIFRTGRILYNVDDYGYVTSDSILFRTDRRIYDEDDLVIGMLINLSPHAIEVRRDEPLIYELNNYGWLPPMGTIWTTLAYPRAYEKGWVQPGGVLSIDMTFLWAKTLTKLPRWKMLELQYFYNGNEYVVYSNELMIGESSQPSRFRTPPRGIINVLSVRAEVVEPYAVALTNNSKHALWFNPLCSDVELDVGRIADDYPYYPVLQRQSGEGTWQVLQSDGERCTTVKGPIRIGPGEKVQLFVGDGYPAPDELEPGVYRWHLVIFIDPFPECNCQPSCCFLSGAHLFTKTFEP